MNYSDKDRIKIYIEQLPIDGKDINSESVDDLIVSNPIPVGYLLVNYISSMSSFVSLFD